jgi:hypothetical protein
MYERRACPHCGNIMEHRLGNYECPACNHIESAATAGPQLQGAGRHLTDAAAGAKLRAKHESEHAVVQSFDAATGTFNPYAKKAPKADTLRDEKIIGLVLAAVALGYPLYYWLLTEDGQVRIGELGTLLKLTDLRALSVYILLGGSVVYLLTIAALFSNQKWLKVAMALVTALIPLCGIAGILMGGLAYNVFFNLAGFILMVGGAILLGLLGHDLTHEATGV